MVTWHFVPKSQGKFDHLLVDKVTVRYILPPTIGSNRSCLLAKAEIGTSVEGDYLRSKGEGNNEAKDL
jgi:hypothetical protein